MGGRLGFCPDTYKISCYISREKNKSVMRSIHDTLILILYVDLYII